MNLESTVPIYLLFVASAILVGLAAYSWQYRHEPAAKWFTGVMASAGLWSLSSAFSITAETLWWSTAWFVILWPVFELTIMFTVLFVLESSGHERWVSPRTVGALAVWPTVITLGVLTNFVGVHDFLWTEATLTAYSGSNVLELAFGLGYYLDAFYGFSLIGFALVTLVYYTVGSHHIYRKQAISMTVAITIPVLVEVFYFWGVFGALNPTPMSFVATGLLFAVGLFRYRILDVVPIARRLVVKHMTDPVVVVDTKDRLVDFNPAARGLFGLTPSHLGASVSTVFDSTTVETLRGESELVVSVETDSVESDTRRYFDVDTITVGDGRDVPRGNLYILHDVTERRVRERWFRTLTENVSDIILVVDADGVVQYVGRSAEQKLGVDTGDIEGNDVFEFVHSDDEVAAREAVEEVLHDPIQERATELRFRSADGACRIYDVRLRNLLDDPVVEGIVVNGRDVTEQKRYEAQLVRQNEQLETFATVVSHDLRNPLNIARGFLDVVMDADEPDPTQYERIDRAHERMEEIIEDVLALARGSRRVDKRERLLVGKVATEAWQNVESGDGQLEVHTNDAVLDADQTRLLQLFENLFRNAVEHGSHDVTVCVGTTEDGFYVEDNGPGVAPEHRSQLFESGYTTSSTGTGFGLAIVKGVVEAHGWEISYETGRDGGARFVVTGVNVEDTAPSPTASSVSAPSDDGER